MVYDIYLDCTYNKIQLCKHITTILNRKQPNIEHFYVSQDKSLNEAAIWEKEWYINYDSNLHIFLGGCFYANT